MRIISLKGGNYSGSNGGIFVDFLEDPNPASARGNTGSDPSIESTGAPLRMYPEISGPYLV